MLKILDEKDRIEILATEIECLYPNKLVLLINMQDRDNECVGTVYALSEEPDTMKELVSIETDLQLQGVRTLVGGDYYSDCMYDYMKIEG